MAMLMTESERAGLLRKARIGQSGSLSVAAMWPEKAAGMLRCDEDDLWSKVVDFLTHVF